MQHDHQTPDNGNRMSTVSRYIFFGFVAVALYFLITEHRAHIVPFLPFLLLAACPLMHLFHHHGHDHNNEEDSERRSPPPNSGSGTHQH